MPVFQFDPPERFVAGTVGQPGERAFFLQATGGGRVTSVALEKQQVAALAERVEELLNEVRERFGALPDEEAELEPDEDPLELPIEQDFQVGTMALAWDQDTGRVIIEAQELSEESAEEDAEESVFAEEGPQLRDVLRVHLTPAAARAFAKRAMRVVAAGRPTCPLCGQALDPSGHVCPRQNGHKRLVL
ncbi:DUF3090 family protein [Lipingzhangella sp. LS1_29]|uniref:DUF3090 family protein n=1 Tax=Lipingzhangella rawalii TaxID=2055835 RepID=A0ABU2H0U0_9ACTN|nr:DUF3090 family protein [Lipingzhangella rawalii]MDS1268923.1 DUF3090 family protein [Lipingzhangella rawalii]